MAIKYRILPIGGGGGITPSGTIEITENGLHDVREYQYADIDIDPPTPPIPDYLCFTATQQNSTVGMTHYGTNQSTTTPVLYYSTDGLNFSQWDFSTITLANIGDKVYFYGNNPNGISYANTDYSYGNNYSKFSISGSFELSGDITTLIRIEGNVTELPPMAFVSLCETCYSLTGTVDLNFVTKVEDGALMRAFQDTNIKHIDCSNIQIIKKHGMHATFARAAVYGDIDFHSLTTVGDTGMWACFWQPTNPNANRKVDLSNLTTVDASGAWGPFYGCFNNNTGLNEVEIGMQTWNNFSFQIWLLNVSPTGDFFNLGGATIPTNSTSGIPTGWTEHTSL